MALVLPGIRRCEGHACPLSRPNHFNAAPLAAAAAAAAPSSCKIAVCTSFPWSIVKHRFHLRLVGGKAKRISVDQRSNSTNHISGTRPFGWYVLKTRRLCCWERRVSSSELCRADTNRKQSGVTPISVLATVLKLGKDGLDIGTNLVPEAVPRPLARVGVAVLGFAMLTTLLNSLLSTALFILAIGGISFFVYFYFNKEERPSGDNIISYDDQSAEKTVEEARKIMDKYK